MHVRILHNITRNMHNIDGLRRLVMVLAHETANASVDFVKVVFGGRPSLRMRRKRFGWRRTGEDDRN